MSYLWYAIWFCRICDAFYIQLLLRDGKNSFCMEPVCFWMYITGVDFLIVGWGIKITLFVVAYGPECYNLQTFFSWRRIGHLNPNHWQCIKICCRFLKGLMEQFNTTSDALVAKLQRYTDGKTNVSMLEEFHRISLDLIGKVLLVNIGR